MRVIPVACLKDNYAYLLVCERTRACAVIDPSEAAPVVAALLAENLRPIMLWCTHHHWDHVGGILELSVKYPGLEVVASTYDRTRIHGLTKTVDGGSVLSLGDLRAHVYEVPGHTLGAIAYAVMAPKRVVFTGDTMFLAGCGRLFEGTPAQMDQSLRTIVSLPADTQIYPGHEYTEANLRFAKTVEPKNLRIEAAFLRVHALRERGEPSVPHTVEEERAVNPFARVDEASVRAYAKLPSNASSADVLGVIRAAKDAF